MPMVSTTRPIGPFWRAKACSTAERTLDLVPASGPRCCRYGSSDGTEHHSGEPADRVPCGAALVRAVALPSQHPEAPGSGWTRTWRGPLSIDRRPSRGLDRNARHPRPERTDSAAVARCRRPPAAPARLGDLEPRSVVDDTDHRHRLAHSFVAALIASCAIRPMPSQRRNSSPCRWRSACRWWPRFTPSSPPL